MSAQELIQLLQRKSINTHMHINNTSQHHEFVAIMLGSVVHVYMCVQGLLLYLHVYACIYQFSKRSSSSIRRSLLRECIADMFTKMVFLSFSSSRGRLVSLAAWTAPWRTFGGTSLKRCTNVSTHDMQTLPLTMWVGTFSTRWMACTYLGNTKHMNCYQAITWTAFKKINWYKSTHCTREREGIDPLSHLACNTGEWGATEDAN